jgi:hypothetical protein
MIGWPDAIVVVVDPVGDVVVVVQCGLFVLWALHPGNVVDVVVLPGVVDGETDDVVVQLSNG